MRPVVSVWVLNLNSLTYIFPCTYEYRPSVINGRSWSVYFKKLTKQESSNSIYIVVYQLGIENVGVNNISTIFSGSWLITYYIQLQVSQVRYKISTYRTSTRSPSNKPDFISNLNFVTNISAYVLRFVILVQLYFIPVDIPIIETNGR